MKSVKSIFAVVLAFCIVLGLCACGDGSNGTETTGGETTNETTAPTTVPQQDTTVPVDDGKVTYTVTVVDEGGNPVANAMVQLCLEACIPGFTNESGVAEFRQAEADYKVSFVALPSGYDYSSDKTEFYFEDGSTEMTITLKAVA